MLQTILYNGNKKIIFDTFFITLFFIIIFILGINEKQIEVKRDEIGEINIQISWLIVNTDLILIFRGNFIA